MQAQGGHCNLSLPSFLEWGALTVFLENDILVSKLYLYSTYKYVIRWKLFCLLIAGSEGGHCNLSSPSFLEWDALTVFLESVMSKFPLAAEPKPAMMEGVELLRSVLNYDTKVSFSNHLCLDIVLPVLCGLSMFTQ